jgi:hypothetical protein
LEPPLLVVLDEAAHIAPLPELDGLAATCASHGIQLVTVWQDLAQVRARYGSRAPTVLNNHRAKVFLPGIADPDTLDCRRSPAIRPAADRLPRAAGRAGSCLPKTCAASVAATRCWSTAPCRRRGSICDRGGLPAAALAVDLSDGADDLVHAR